MKRRVTIRPAHESAARYAAGRHASKISGSAPAAMSGIRSTLVASALPVFISALTRSASRAADGRRIPIGTRSNESAGAMDSKKAMIR